jgi:hypothetical protein
VTNESLMRSKIIESPLTPEEIWSITDIHDTGLPYSLGDGISVSLIGRALDDYRPVSIRSYGFFGCFPSELPAGLREREEALSRRRELSGKFIAGIWERC